MLRFVCLFVFCLQSIDCFSQGVTMSMKGVQCQGTVIGDGLVLTAAHCWSGHAVGTDAVVMRLDGFDGPVASFGKIVPGAAYCWVVRNGQRVRVDFEVSDVGYVGYFRSSWAPISGDSGSAVYQDGAIVGVVSWRSTWGVAHGGISTLDLDEIASILGSIGEIIDELPELPWFDPPKLQPKQQRIIRSLIGLLRRLL